MATVQLTVFKSEADYFEAEVPVCSAGSGVFLDKFFLQIWSVPWDVWWLNFFLLGGLDLRPATKRYVGTNIVL